MALVFALGIRIFPLSIATILALLARTLLTGALHEDGLADLADGMGGGHGRERVLTIMKDSHIGTFGVIALVIYYLTIYSCLRALPVALVIITADVWARICTTLVVGMLSYARTSAEAKSQLTYEPLRWLPHVLRCLIALAPLACLWWYVGYCPNALVFIVPVLVTLLLALWYKARIGGYTGDCLGATFLIAEASVYLTWIATLR